MPASKPLKPGTVVCARWFTPGYPLALSVDTRCTVVERRDGRYRVEREDGRQGSWWMDRNSLRVFGEE